MGFIIIISIIVLVVLWAISTQRSLVVLDENVTNALNQINVVLSSRFDALTQLFNLVKGYNEHEYKTLVDLTKMRQGINKDSTAKDIEGQESIFSNAMKQFVAVAENYPELKSNENYKNIMNSLNEYEDKVRTTRLVYNDTVTKLNRTIRMFPTSLIAPMFGIHSRDYLAVEESKKDMPNLV